MTWRADEQLPGICVIARTLELFGRIALNASRTRSLKSNLVNKPFCNEGGPKKQSYQRSSSCFYLDRSKSNIVAVHKSWL